MPRNPPSRKSFIMKLPVSIWPMAASPRSRSFFSWASQLVYGNIAANRATIMTP